MHTGSGLNLEDLRYFLALARHGRLVVAADRLAVEHTTVSRRVAALEKAIGERLFERTRGGWVLTEAGRRLLPHAEQIETSAMAAVADATGESMPASGVVRLVSTDAFGSSVLTPMLADLHREHPGISAELVTTSQLLAYRTGEFDIAITLHRPELPRFWTRELADYALRLYAAPSYVAAAPTITGAADLTEHEMVWYIDSLVGLPELQFFSDVIESPRFAFRSSNVFAQREAVAAGIGLGLLPCFIAQSDPRLVPVLHDTIEIHRTFWMVVPRPLTNVRRVQTVCQFVQDAMPGLAERLIP